MKFDDQFTDQLLDPLIHETTWRQLRQSLYMSLYEQIEGTLLWGRLGNVLQDHIDSKIQR